MSPWWAHAALVAPLRASGKRTLSKLNAFDLVVTVALGSTLATALLSKDVALAGPQWAVAKLSLRSPRSSRLVKAEPRLPPHRGRFLDGALRDERVTRDEVLAALRAAAWRTRRAWPRWCWRPAVRSTWSATRRRKRAPPR